MLLFGPNNPPEIIFAPPPASLSYACASKSEHPSRRIHRGDVAATFESPSADLVARPAALGFPLVLHRVTGDREEKEANREVRGGGTREGRASVLSRPGGSISREKREREGTDEITRPMQLA